MSHHHLLSSVTEDRDLSRAAAERYLMLQALTEHQVKAPDSSRSRLATVQQAVRAWLRNFRRANVTAEPARPLR